MKYLYTLCILYSFSLLSTIHAEGYEAIYAPCDSNNIISFSPLSVCKDDVSNIIQLANDIGGVVGNYGYFISDINGDIVAWDANMTSYDINTLASGLYLVYGISYQGILNIQVGIPVNSISASDCFTLSGNQLIIEIYELPSTAMAGADINSCSATSIELEGNSPQMGTGIWTQISGNTAAILNPNQASAIVTDLTTGSYQFEWTISNGNCQISRDTVEVIIGNTSFQIDTIYVSDETCFENNDGTITIEVSGNTSSLNYDIGTMSVTTSAGQHTFTSLPAGNYPISVSDNTGCSANGSAVVAQPDSLYVAATAMAESQVGASDGSIDICLEGGTPPYQSPSISPNFPILTLPFGTCDGNYEVNNLPTGDYVFTIEDANGCTVTDTITVPPSNCTIKIDSVTVDSHVACHGDLSGQMTVYASGSDDYEFSNNNGASYNNSNSSTFAYGNLAGGDYHIIVQNDMGCADTLANPITIIEPAAFLTTGLMTEDVSQPGMSDGQIEFCLNGGTPPYTATYTGNNTGTTGNFTDVGGNCSADFEATGLPADTYVIEIIDSLGCPTTFDAIINDFDCSTFSVNITTNDVLCNGGNTGSIAINTSGGFAPFDFIIYDGLTSDTVSTSIANHTFTNLPEGEYAITAMHSGECAEVNQISITEPLAITINNSMVNNPTAINGTDGEICFTPTGGTGNYIITADCGTVIQGSGNCGGSYHIPGLGAGVCNIEIKDENDCVYTHVETLADPNCVGFSLMDVESTDILCGGEMTGTITAVVSGGQAPYQYSIDGAMNSIGNNNNTYTFVGLSPGTYNVVVTDDRGCLTGVSTVEITEPDALNVTADATATCPGEESGGIDISATGGTPPYIYFWNTGSADEDIDQLAAGTYMFTVTDDNSCTYEETVEISEYTAITVDAGMNVIIDVGDSTQINANVSATQDYTASWSPTSGLSNPSSLMPLANPLATTLYTLTITSDEGCVYTDNITVQVNALRDVIAIPSAFTPNGDNENDDFKVLIQGQHELLEFYVFNRWGEQVFYSTDINTGWDGTYKNQDQPVGTYVYLVKYRSASGSLVDKSGDVTLLR